MEAKKEMVAELCRVLRSYSSNPVRKAVVVPFDDSYLDDEGEKEEKKDEEEYKIEWDFGKEVVVKEEEGGEDPLFRLLK